MEIKPKKWLGQHFLGSEEAAEKISDLVPCKNVLEIGPGLGALTTFLVKKVKKLTVIEIDAQLEQILKKKFRKNVEIKIGDCLKEDFSRFEVIVGLLPFNISPQVIEKFIQSEAKQGIFVVQKELAQRMVAEPGSTEYSRFSVLVQNNCKCEMLETYPPSFFWPQPKVQSTLVKLEKKEPLKINQVLVNSLFQHKNQKVKKALKHSRHLLGASAEELIKKIGELGEKKVVQLTLQELSDMSEE